MRTNNRHAYVMWNANTYTHTYTHRKWRLLQRPDWLEKKNTKKKKTDFTRVGLRESESEWVAMETWAWSIASAHIIEVCPVVISACLTFPPLCISLSLPSSLLTEQRRDIFKSRWQLSNPTSSPASAPPSVFLSVSMAWYGAWENEFKSVNSR